MMKTYLLTSYHKDKNPDRQKELHACLEINIKNFDKVILFGTQPFDFTGWNTVDWVPKIDRVRFTDFLECIKTINDPDGIFVMANADIFFKKKEFFDVVQDFYRRLSGKYMLALSRWDVFNFANEDRFTADPFLRPDSADCWVIKGLPLFTQADFKMGVPGCDNVFPHAADVAGYKVVNPSHEIKIYHLHISNVRNYSLPNGEVTERYGPPYLMVHPCTLNTLK